MTEWTCDDCGLHHTHSRGNHTVFNLMDWEDAKKLEYNQDCNCGAYEAKVRGFVSDIYPTVPEPVKSDIDQKYK